MATAKKLPSGNWRCKVFAGYKCDDSGERKRVYESFTAPTRKEAELLAAKWAVDRSERPEDITVARAVEKYIESRRGVLSPSTLRGYQVCKPRFAGIAHLKLTQLKTSNVQPWISELSLTLSRKTIQNTFGLLTAVLDYFGVDTHFKVRFPAKKKNEYDLPTDEEIRAVLDEAYGTPMWAVIMLARYYSLRRSEICALDRRDLRGDVLTIHRACVMDEDGAFVIKETPKTYASYRKLVIGEPLLSALPHFLPLGLNPGMLSDRFRAVVASSGVRPFNFHLLRHVFATKAAMAGIPDFYVAKIGGWEQNSSALKRIYQNVQPDELSAKMQSLNEIMHHEMHHESKKPAI